MKNNSSNEEIQFTGDDVDILRRLGTLVAPHTLYMVGGCVRDKFLRKKEIGDIDIASTISVTELKKRIEGSGFKVVGIIENTGTAIIKYLEHKYEYTRFRKDLYKQESGEHKPEKVVFVDNIKIDAERRDFKVNAIYRDVVSGEIVDPLGGVQEIENKILSTTRNPENVFEEDGLRLMRLARFVGQLGFEIEEKTLDKAKENVWRIKDIASERILDELSKMLALGGKKTVQALKTIFQIGLDKYVLDISTKVEDVEYLISDESDMVARWGILFMNVGDEEKIKLYFQKMGASKKLATEVARVCFIYNKQASDKVELMKFIIENQEVIPNLISFNRILNRLELAKELEETLKQMKYDKVPMSIKELPLNGQDLIDLGIPNIMRGKVLNDLLMAILSDFTLRDRDLAMKYVKEKYNTEKTTK